MYLIGKPGVGKYTIAKVLAKNYGFIVCDNQLINNPIFALLNYDSYMKIPSFAWDSISTIRTEIFAFLTKIRDKSYVLTNCLAENDEDRSIYAQVQHMAELRESLFVPVKLLLTKEEHLKRLTNPARRERWKSINPEDAEDNGPLLSVVHPHYLELEVSSLSPEKAAETIMNHVNRLNHQ